MISTRSHGFTLIELSIVLVIIAFIVGSVLAGKALTHASEIRALAAQPAELDAAINTFKMKYNCLPGDCKNASDLGFTTTNATYPVNGNGDWKIEFESSGNPDASSESLKVAPILKQAGLIQTSILPDGTGGIGDVFAMKMPAFNEVGIQGVWTVEYLLPGAGAGNINFKPGHYYIGSASDIVGNSATLLPSDAFAIDQKLDDGLPRSGTILASGHQEGEQNSPSDSNGNYYVYSPTFDPVADVGPAGATSNYCVTNDSPNQYNILNESRGAGSLCTITVKATF